jgi:hypothetical protein
MTRLRIRLRLEGEGFKKRVAIRVPALGAQILEIGEDCTGLGRNNYVMEKIGKSFTNERGQEMVR